MQVTEHYLKIKIPKYLVKVWLGVWMLANFMAVFTLGCKMWNRHRYEFGKSIKGFISFYVCFTGVIVGTEFILDQES